MRPLPSQFEPYAWALSTAEIARIARIPAERVLRFDGNVPPKPPSTARAATIADELQRINAYPHGGYPRIHEALAEYAGVEPDNVVLGAGADDLIMLCGRAFAAPGDTVAVADEPTYPVFRMAAWVAGALVGDRRPWSRSAAARTTRPARSSVFPLPDRSSWTRRTTSTQAERRRPA